MKQQRAELAHASRLSTMGEMAAGFAHELNQPLTAISAYTRSCMRRLQAGIARPDTLLTTMEKVAEQAERAGDIIRRLRSFIHPRQLVASTTDINTCVREAISLIEHEANLLGLSIDLNLAERLPCVIGNRIEIVQVIVNLVRNGLEAMKSAESPDGSLVIHTSATGEGRVRVAVSDRGIGLSGEEMARLFRPFHSTKPEGMGMGLAISRRIVEAHGGELWAESNPDCGATFTFNLPAADESCNDER